MTQSADEPAPDRKQADDAESQPQTDLHATATWTGLKAPLIPHAWTLTISTVALSASADSTQTETFNSGRTGFDCVFSPPTTCEMITLSARGSHHEIAHCCADELIEFDSTTQAKSANCRVPAPPLTRHTARGYLSGALSLLLLRSGLFASVGLGMSVLGLGTDRSILIGITLLMLIWIGADMIRAAAQSPGVIVTDQDW